jgi:hypothetical protein
VAEALLIVAVVIAALAIAVWLTRRAPRFERIVRGGPAPTVVPPRPPGGPGRGSDGPGPGTREPRRPRPQLGAGAVQLPLPLPKRRPTRAVGRPLPPDR